MNPFHKVDTDAKTLRYTFECDFALLNEVVYLCKLSLARFFTQSPLSILFPCSINGRSRRFILFGARCFSEASEVVMRDSVAEDAKAAILSATVL